MEELDYLFRGSNASSRVGQHIVSSLLVLPSVASFSNWLSLLLHQRQNALVVAIFGGFGNEKIIVYLISYIITLILCYGGI